MILVDNRCVEYERESRNDSWKIGREWEEVNWFEGLAIAEKIFRAVALVDTLTLDALSSTNRLSLCLDPNETRN